MSCDSDAIQFTCALDKFLQEMYAFANPRKNPHKQPNVKPKWLAVQDLAFNETDKERDQKLQRLVQHAERRSIKLPMVRVALEKRIYEDDQGKTWTVEKDHTVILDIVSTVLAHRRQYFC
jgi:hypothetical protein